MHMKCMASKTQIIQKFKSKLFGKLEQTLQSCWKTQTNSHKEQHISREIKRNKHSMIVKLKYQYNASTRASTRKCSKYNLIQKQLVQSNWQTFYTEIANVKRSKVNIIHESCIKTIKFPRNMLPRCGKIK